MSSRKKFFIIYGLLIIIVLLVMFILPDKMFIKSSTSKKIEKKEKFIDYEKQKNKLIKGNYNYHFDIDYNSVIYKCNVIYKDNNYEGECNKPKKINFTKDNLKEKLKDVDINFLNPKYIFDSIKDIEPKEEKMYDKRTYTYNVKLYGLDGKIIVYTNYKDIYQISIMNGYFTYVIYYDNEK